MNINLAMLERAFYFALGKYWEKHTNKDVSWRAMNITDVYAHLANEIEEIRGDLKTLEIAEMGYLLENAVDAVGLSVILVATVMIKEGLLQEDGK